jgi:hypothetical protein
MEGHRTEDWETSQGKKKRKSRLYFLGAVLIRVFLSGMRAICQRAFQESLKPSQPLMEMTITRT